MKWRNVRNGGTTTEQAKVVVLAAGPVETPRLWLNSGLPNPNDQVGRGLTDHYLDYLVGRFSSYTGSSKGPTSAARLDFPGFGGLEQAGVSPGLQGQGLTSSDSGIAGFYDGGGRAGAWGADAVGRLVGERLKRFMSNIDRLDRCGADHRRRRPTAKPRHALDDDGARRARPGWPARDSCPVASNLEEPGVPRGACGRAPARGGRPRGDPGQLPGLAAASAQHDAHGHEREPTQSSTPMPNRAGSSACSSRTTPLYPNSLGGPNPTLTTQALATRTAEKIFVRYFGGDPWVGRESPVSSVDDTVTQAVLAAGL